MSALADVQLVDPSDSHRAELAAITSDPETMRMVGNGRPWDDAKLGRFLEHAAADAATPPAERENFYKVVIARAPSADASGAETETVCGVVGIHPAGYAASPPAAGEKWFLTIFLGARARGRGVGAEAIRAILAARGEADVFLDVRLANAPMRALAKKMGHVALRRVRIRGAGYMRYRAVSPADSASCAGAEPADGTSPPA